MGVLVQNGETKEFTFYLKGADSVMVKKLNENEKIFVNEETELLSRQGGEAKPVTLRPEDSGDRLQNDDARASQRVPGQVDAGRKESE